MSKFKDSINKFLEREVIGNHVYVVNNTDDGLDFENYIKVKVKSYNWQYHESLLLLYENDGREDSAYVFNTYKLKTDDKKVVFSVDMNEGYRKALKEARGL